jgi:hypothetical protein
LACGGGRHGLLFAQQGHSVTFVDRDTATVAPIVDSAAWSNACRVITCNLEDGSPWSLGSACFDLVIVSNYLYRPHLADLFAALDNDGLLLYETFALGNEAFGKPRSPEFLLRPGELLQKLPAFMSVIAYEHGMEQRSAGPRVIQRLCAQRATAPRALNSPLT